MKLINRIFNLRPGDFARGIPLFAYYLLIITFYMMGRIVRDAIFLHYFNAVNLPYGDMSVAALSVFIVAPYIRAGRRASLPRLQIASLVFFAANLTAFWWGLHFKNWAWLAGVFYVWVGICGILAFAQVWTLANFVWTTREAKRLFGLLGSGGIIGGSVAGYLAKWIAKQYGTDATLLVMAGLLLTCTALIPIIWKQKPSSIEEPVRDETSEAPRNVRESFQIVRQSPHLLLLSALICLSSVVTAVGGWQLKAVAQAAWRQKDVYTQNMGALQFYIGIASLVVQLLITTKFLRRFGVGMALLILPLSLALGSVAILISGALWAAIYLRASDGVIRYSIDTSAVQLLYLPVPAKIKVQVKSFIDTVIWKLGDGIAAVTLLVFATSLHLSAPRISWVNFVFLTMWIIAAFLARRQYIATLKENIQSAQIQPDQTSVPVLDSSTSAIFAEKLASQDPNEIMYALDLFEIGQQVKAHSLVRNLLDHPSPHIRKRAIAVLGAASDLTVKPRVTALIRDDSIDVRTEALLYLSRHDDVDPMTYVDQLGDFSDFSIRSATVSFLANSGEPQNLQAAQMILDAMSRDYHDDGRQMRLEAAQLIAHLPDHFETQLAVLLEDEDLEVLRQAIRAVGSLRKQRFVPALIRNLGNAAIASDAADALALFGDTVIGTLRDHLDDRNERIEIRRQIPEVMLSIGTSTAAKMLEENLIQGDIDLRFRIISALNKLCDLRRNLTLDSQNIETAMLAEIMGHYRSYQILGKKNGAPPDDDLKRSMNGEIERIFRLMKLMFPSLDLQNAYLGIQSSDPVIHANALEFLDNTLNPQLRSRLVPLIDSEVNTQERVRLADRFLGFTARV